ncbi:hypothetical protein GDO81_004646 [Engystomops pustulosus]|uniref:Uncharacterized protein n=1 Tax=Engystomops pustulosus TaxID=76066 RepID=A0AAV7CHR3_ENGPU|nr:hypothetical protein GDO81_004646 [Engystomops pustulosus]
MEGESEILKLLRQSGGVPVHRFILFLLDVLDRTCLVGEAFLCPSLHLGTEVQPRLVTVLVRYCQGIQVLQDDLVGSLVRVLLFRGASAVTVVMFRSGSVGTLGVTVVFFIWDCRVSTVR